jgi:hypothetical protein
VVSKVLRVSVMSPSQPCPSAVHRPPSTVPHLSLSYRSCLDASGMNQGVEMSPFLALFIRFQRFLFHSEPGRPSNAIIGPTGQPPSLCIRPFVIRSMLCGAGWRSQIPMAAVEAVPFKDLENSNRSTTSSPARADYQRLLTVHSAHPAPSGSICIAASAS